MVVVSHIMATMNMDHATMILRDKSSQGWHEDGVAEDGGSMRVTTVHQFPYFRLDLLEEKKGNMIEKHESDKRSSRQIRRGGKASGM